MLVSLWLALHFIALTLTVAFGSHLPSSPFQALLLLAVGALIVAVVVPRTVLRTLTRALLIAPNAPPSGLRVRTAPVRRYPGEPGTRGTAMVRAPSFVVHASA
ncbi:hypothetical protein [Microbacterium halotolerans]|uniref:hypothetical protein n=1 Tax=Microbacterium halotolerans TaxID=246613 RepID=UPI0013C2B084|nr:hypothetical protein [Microbacterium halotolerans]